MAAKTSKILLNLFLEAVTASGQAGCSPFPLLCYPVVGAPDPRMREGLPQELLAARIAARILARGTFQMAFLEGQIRYRGSAVVEGAATAARTAPHTGLVTPQAADGVIDCQVGPISACLHRPA